MSEATIATISEGISLFSGDPTTGVPVEKQIPVPREGRGWIYISVVTAAHASDTTGVAIHGKLAAGDSYRALKMSDQSTAAAAAQSGGAAVSSVFACQLMPYMKVVLSGTSTTGASTKVFAEAVGNSSRTDA